MCLQVFNIRKSRTPSPVSQSQYGHCFPAKSPNQAPYSNTRNFTLLVPPWLSSQKLGRARFPPFPWTPWSFSQHSLFKGPEPPPRAVLFSAWWVFKVEGVAHLPGIFSLRLIQVFMPNMLLRPISKHFLVLYQSFTVRYSDVPFSEVFPTWWRKHLATWCTS